MDWIFCGRKCQDAFHALYGQWLRTDPRQEDVLMVDPTEFERAAMRACLKCFGEAAGEIGFDKPLGHYSEAEALQVIEATEAGELLPRGFAEASHFECKFCSYAQRCWGGER
jgi:hypothetical protein